MEESADDKLLRIERYLQDIVKAVDTNVEEGWFAREMLERFFFKVIDPQQLGLDFPPNCS